MAAPAWPEAPVSQTNFRTRKRALMTAGETLRRPNGRCPAASRGTGRSQIHRERPLPQRRPQEPQGQRLLRRLQCSRAATGSVLCCYLRPNGAFIENLSRGSWREHRPPKLMAISRWILSLQTASTRQRTISTLSLVPSLLPPFGNFPPERLHPGRSLRTHQTTHFAVKNRPATLFIDDSGLAAHCVQAFGNDFTANHIR